MANGTEHDPGAAGSESPGSEEQLAEARRKFADFAEKAAEALSPGSRAAGPLLEGLLRLTEQLGAELPRLDDRTAAVVRSLRIDLSKAVVAGGAATGAAGTTAPAPGLPPVPDDALEAVRHAREAADAAQEAAAARAHAWRSAQLAWEAKTAAVAELGAAQAESYAARQDAEAAKEVAATALEEARSAGESARAADATARVALADARTAREQAVQARERERSALGEAREAEELAGVARLAAERAEKRAEDARDDVRRQQDRARTAGEAADAAETERVEAEAAREAAEHQAAARHREREQAEARKEEALLRAESARQEAAAAEETALEAEAEAETLEREAAGQQESRETAERRRERARTDVELERARRVAAETEADEVERELAATRTATAQAREREERARRARFPARLEEAVNDIWEIHRERAFAFGTEKPPAGRDAASLWTRAHVALLRLPEPDRRQAAARLAALAREGELEPGEILPGEPEPTGAAPTVVAVPSLSGCSGYDVQELRLTTDAPRWPDLTDDERAEVSALLDTAKAEAEGRSEERLAALLPTPPEGDLLLTVLLRIWQADRLLALDPALGRWPDGWKRKWVPWDREEFRKQAVHQLALLASVYPEPVEGWRWAKPEDAQTAVTWLHSLDAVLGFHHRAPALRGSWWWSWRLALVEELVHPAGWAGRRAVVDPDELTRLFTGTKAKDYFEQPDICDRVSPPIQWLTSPPLVATDQSCTPRCLRKGRIIRGVGRA